MSDDWGTMPGEQDWDFADGECPFCNCQLKSKKIFADCDDEEIYCPECGYVQGIE